jgi:hypothetical protein
VNLAFPFRLADRLDFEAAVKLELENPRTMLPSRVVEAAVERHANDYAGVVRARVQSTLNVEPQETVWAPKPGPVGRYRPILSLPLQERVLFRALTESFPEDVERPDRSGEAFGAFERQPLETGDAYVVVADTASFYFFIDHQLLEQRIVDATAQADTAQALHALLQATMQRSYGLPQNFSATNVLAELYIGWAERRLRRDGIVTFRHNDDFRMSAASWGDGLRSLERLQEELSAIGLDLNGEKSRILKRERYEQNLGLTFQLVREALPDDEEFVNVDPYTGDPIEDDGDTDSAEAGRADNDLSDDELEAMTARVFEAAAEARLADERMNGFELRANRTLINIALFHFRRIKSQAALGQGPALVALDPALAHAYAGYLVSLAGTEAIDLTSERILAVLQRFEGHAPYWVQAWLVEPLLAAGSRLDEPATEWLRGLLNSPAPGVLRSRAALALAAHRRVDPATLLSLFDALPTAAKPDIVAALGFLRPTDRDQVRSVTETEHLYNWIFEVAIEREGDFSWA